ncbi:MAG: sterol desaturase family protein [Xanthobacteraceae bacterium]|nr:sterol desaturase family protein [Xanthobacteraceae bacterium]
MTFEFFTGPGSGPKYRLMLAAIALGLMLIEYLFHRLNHDESYDTRETAASLTIALGNKLIAGSFAAMMAFPFAFAYLHRLFSIPLDNAWSWLALFLCVEFSYYVHHVAMHKIRWFWATHAVHHSATKMNLSAAVRLGWGGYLTGGFLFYVPLVVLGFNPVAVLAILGVGLFYQFFLHVASPPDLGPLEWILNTPRHHHVHHASNPDCLDRNFGSMLIIFDRMFGTFAEAPRNEKLRFGLVGVRPTANPVLILFGGWYGIFREALFAKGLRAKLDSLFGRPI